MQHLHNHELPDFLVKSTTWVSLSAIFILIPFTVISCLADHYLTCFIIVLIIGVCAVNIRLGIQGRYNIKLNQIGGMVLILACAITLYTLGVIASYWPMLTVLSLYFILPQKQAQILNALLLVIITPIAWQSLHTEEFIRFFAVLIATSVFALTSTYEFYKKYHLIKEQSITDLMTGLYNRSLLQATLENAIHQYQRSNINMAILMIDIDHFKSINDQLGHDIGDQVLKETGQFLKNIFRATDIVFRIGGEEFLALIYNTDEQAAIAVAEKLRLEFEKLSLLPDRTITVSIGVATLKKIMDWKQWMKRGDENLYKAKANGRNQVVSK